VNLAARLEQLTKETGARLLLSDPVRAAAAASDAVDLGALPVRGYDQPVPSLAAAVIWYFAYGSNMNPARLSGSA
jgi:class 3 adenylate cyclase